MFLDVPAEMQIFGLYIPPLFVAIVAGLLCAVGLARLLNRTGLSRYFWHPPLALFSLWLLSSALIGLFFIAP
jgi:hypothetical protein